MTPIYQSRPTTRHKVGNCFEACIATLLDVPLKDVPDMTGKAKEGEVVSDEDALYGLEWLRRRGMGYIEIGMQGPLPDLLALMKKMQRHSAYILTGRTAGGSVHSVVARGGDIIHDPAGLWDDTTVLVHPAGGNTFRVGFLTLLL